MAGISKEEYALLDAIARSESAGAWNVIYGGSTFNDYSAHPREFVTIKSGPNKGKKSSAAGKYQITSTTYDRVAPKLGITDFSPASQQKIALYLAREKYGPNLAADLKAGKVAQVGRALKGVWTSLPGGIEQGTNDAKFTKAYTKAYSAPTPPGFIPDVASELSTGGNNVSSVQQQLAQKGFDPGPIDGVSGPRTKAAIREFQKASGLKVDGIVGPKTQAALSSGARPTTQNPNRAAVAQPKVTQAGSVTLPPSLASLNPAMPPRPAPGRSATLQMPMDRPTSLGPNVQQASLRSLGGDFQPLPAPASLKPQYTDVGRSGPSWEVLQTLRGVADGDYAPSRVERLGPGPHRETLTRLKEVAAPVPMSLPAARRPVLEPASKVLGEGKVQLPRPRPQVASLTPRTITGEEPATGGFGGFLGGIGSNLQALGGNVMEGARTLGQKAGEVTETVGAKIEEGARAMVPEMLRTVEGRTALLDPMISNIGTDQPLKYANIKRKRAEVQANRQKTGVASQVSTSPGNNQTFKGSSGRTYTVGKTYSNAKGSFIAQPGGKFTPVPAKAPVQTNQLAINPNLSGRTDRFANTVDQFGMVI